MAYQYEWKTSVSIRLNERLYLMKLKLVLMTELQELAICITENSV